jgi:hypothetical protein
MIADRQPRSFLDPQALARLAAVPLVARRPMVGNVSGRHASPHRGSSVQFAEYRKIGGSRRKGRSTALPQAICW